MLVAWAGVETQGATSAYIAADSRISWGEGNSFDHGRKVFAFRRSPDIVGYCGDILFPTIVLSQITEMVDCGLLFGERATCRDRFDAIKRILVQQFTLYPSMVKTITEDTLDIIHISRDIVNGTKFECRRLRWTRETGWAPEELKPFPAKSDVLFSLGSGAKEFSTNLTRYYDPTLKQFHGEPETGTTREVFQCFCSTLSKTSDRRCGGAPQLVGIYSGMPPVTYGIIIKDKRYYLGVEIDDAPACRSIEWRNDQFELCDGETRKRLHAAQSQPTVLKKP